jgi:hypothetical protein
MATTGSGTGTPIAVTTPTTCPGLPEPMLSLPEYWRFLQINEIAGWGIRNFPTTGVLGMGCGDYWDHKNRYFLAKALMKAQERVESDRWLGFPVRAKYIGPMQLEYKPQVFLNKYVRGIGVETQTAIQLSKSISLRTAGVINDPITFTVTVDFTDTNELIICYPGQTDCHILPESVSISGTTATVTIPRCRLLRPEYHKDYAADAHRPNYNDDEYFLDSVDVYRNYLNTSTGANVVWWKHVGFYNCFSNVWACDTIGTCSDIRQLACGYVVNQRQGLVQFQPATYDSGWTRNSFAVNRVPDGLEVNMQRGYYQRYTEIDADLQRALIAIAHNNLPQEYCSCSQQKLYYEDDTRPLEPAVRMGMGRSTWGLYESEQIIREFDKDRHAYKGGLL